MKRVIVANPDEPRTGDFAFELYNKAHPITGTPKNINLLRGQLRGLRGRDVIVTVRGAQIDDDTREEYGFRVRVPARISRYSDLFGPGGAYLDAIKSVQEKYSSSIIVTYTITIEDA